MIGYKLFRVRKDKSIGSLFINKKEKLPMNEWLAAENHPTKGFKERPGWHVMAEPHAPHLSPKGRQWYMVEVACFNTIKRPQRQGGLWFLADFMKILGPIPLELTRK